MVCLPPGLLCCCPRLKPPWSLGAPCSLGALHRRLECRTHTRRAPPRERRKTPLGSFPVEESIVQRNREVVTHDSAGKGAIAHSHLLPDLRCRSRATYAQRQGFRACLFVPTMPLALTSNRSLGGGARGTAAVEPPLGREGNYIERSKRTRCVQRDRVELAPKTERARSTAGLVARSGLTRELALADRPTQLALDRPAIRRGDRSIVRATSPLPHSRTSRHRRSLEAQVT